MTREGAIIILTNTASFLRDGTRYFKPEHEKQFRKAYEMAIKALEQAEPQWIPVTERLPKVSGNCLVSEHSPLGEFTCTRYWNQGDRRGYWSGDGYSTVTAWMPLPEPFQGE